MNISQICLFAALVAAAVAFRVPKEEFALKAGVQQGVFDQAIDHFGHATGTFKQRYWVDEQYFTDKSGPVLLNICGEAECGGITDDWIGGSVAPAMNALNVMLEHRYYGESLPFDSLETENMRYLHAENALEDLRAFLFYVQEKYIGVDDSANVHNPWIIIGGSYSGALSAWYRNAFPETVVGAVSSSGVVEAILNFTRFDEQIFESAGADCAPMLQDITADIMTMIEDPSQRPLLMSKFGMPSDTQDGDFLYYMADGMTLPFQYGYYYDVCPQLDTMINQQGMSNVDAWSMIMNGLFTKQFGGYETYLTSYQLNVNVGPEDAARQWWWQKCSELAYWQVAPEVNSVRSQWVNFTYHVDHCKQVFGDDMIVPDVDATNDRLGGYGVAQTATNIIFSHGSQDPWQWSGVRAPDVGTGNTGHIVSCLKCGHCIDLRGCPEGGCDNGADDDLNQWRVQMVATMNSWVAAFSA